MRPFIRRILEVEVITSEEAGKLLKVNDSRIRQNILKGRIKALKKGKTWLLDKWEVDRYVKGRLKLE